MSWSFHNSPNFCILDEHKPKKHKKETDLGDTLHPVNCMFSLLIGINILIPQPQGILMDNIGVILIDFMQVLGYVC